MSEWITREQVESALGRVAVPRHWHPEPIKRRGNTRWYIEVHETEIQDDRGLVAVLGRWKGMEGGFLVRFGPWDEEMM